MQPEYVLGHSAHELERLSRQAQFLAPVTRQYLQDSGITAGMRVLDVGSGGGDVAFLAADLVGSEGSVVGCDTSPAAVAAATANAADRRYQNVSFLHGDPSSLQGEARFDAVVGRYVLIFQADPAAMLRAVADRVRPGGVIVFHEPDWRFARSYPPLPTYDSCCDWVRTVTERVGTPWSSLDRLAEMFSIAGLPLPTMRAATHVSVVHGSDEWLRALCDIITTLHPAIEATGTATAAQIDINTLLPRMLQEAAARRPSTVVGRTEVAAWCRTSTPLSETG